ncbi:hypothetical protein OG345_41725 (plasmid) [Streptomyces sp. NBC_01220]|nr:hypothetical protein OG345_41725 [Streptomyces sp. NBC_01220]
MTGIEIAMHWLNAMVPAWARDRRLWQVVTFGTAIAMYVIAAESGQR